MKKCNKHDWEFEVNDYCPVCFGEKSMSDTLIATLENIMVSREKAASGGIYSKTIGVQEMVYLIKSFGLDLNV